MTTNPQDTEDTQAKRLIVENRNEDGSYDLDGIAKDITSLVNAEVLKALDSIELPEPYRTPLELDPRGYEDGYMSARSRGSREMLYEVSGAIATVRSKYEGEGNA
jgi:hypothetical protein